MKLPEEAHDEYNETLHVKGATYVLTEHGAMFYNYAGENIFFIPHNQFKWIFLDKTEDINELE